MYLNVFNEVNYDPSLIQAVLVRGEERSSGFTRNLGRPPPPCVLGGGGAHERRMTHAPLPGNGLHCLQDYVLLESSSLYSCGPCINIAFAEVQTIWTSSLQCNQIKK